MKYITQILCMVVTVSGVAQSKLPIYDNIKIVKEYQMDLDENKVFIEAPFASPVLNTKSISFQDREISKITYLYSYNNNHPEFAQSKLSDQRYGNLVKILSKYDLTNVVWETNAQAGCGEIPCSEKLYHGFVIEFKDPAKFLGHHQLETQSFFVDNSMQTTITGKNGTKLEIPANGFVDAFGNPVEGEINIQLVEAVTIEDIVLGGMFTVTEDGDILESKGMINITASQGNKELELNGTAEIKVELPTTYEEGYQYFQGLNEHGELVWTNPKNMDNVRSENENSENNNIISNNQNGSSDKISEREKDNSFFDEVTSKEMMDFFPLKANYEKGKLKSVIVMNYGKRQMIYPHNASYSDLQLKGFTEDQTDMIIGWFQKDTVIHEKLQWTRENTMLMTDQRNSQYNQGTLSNNIFSMKKTGWANCDKFSNARETMPTIANFGSGLDYQSIQMSLVLPNDNVLISGYEKIDGSFFFPNAPTGKKAVIIATGIKEGNKFCAIKEFKIGELDVHELEPLQTTDEEITNLIKKAI